MLKPKWLHCISVETKKGNYWLRIVVGEVVSLPQGVSKHHSSRSFEERVVTSMQ